MSTTQRKSSLLLLEPDHMLRRTVALTARSANLAEVREATSIDNARALLKSDAFDGVLLTLSTEDHELELIENVRAGKTASSSGATIAVMVTQCDADRAKKLQLLGVNQIILRPFKVKTLLTTIQAIAA
jgi:DNA-binding response OmpR family regulator